MMDDALDIILIQVRNFDANFIELSFLARHVLCPRECAHVARTAVCPAALGWVFCDFR